MARRARDTDPIAEVRRNWEQRWEFGDHLAASTAIQQASQLIHSRIRAELEAFDLSFASYEALMLLSFAHGGAIDQRSMGLRLMVQPASMSNTVSRLEERGLVTKERDPDDGRRMTIKLTTAGERLVNQVSGPLQRIRFGVADFTDEQIVGLNRILRRLREVAGEVDTAAPNPWYEDRLTDGVGDSRV